MTRAQLPVGSVLYGRLARISRPKLSGPGTHEGVIFPSGMVVDISAGAGIQVRDLETFRAGKVVHIEAEVPRRNHGIAISQTQALLRENAPYDLVVNNCEIFARKATLAKPNSPQVAFWAIVGFLVGAYALRGKL